MMYSVYCMNTCALRYCKGYGDPVCMLLNTKFCLAWQHYCVKGDTNLTMITNMVLHVD